MRRAPATIQIVPFRKRLRWPWRFAIALALCAFGVLSLWASTVFLKHFKPWYAAAPTVVSVIDGDTIDVRIGTQTHRIRLLGIDTPEIKDPRKPVQCFGPEASANTKQLLPRGTVVQLATDTETKDHFGRDLAYVWRKADGLFINKAIADAGFADLLIIEPNVAHASELQKAVMAAKENKLGRWGACPQK